MEGQRKGVKEINALLVQGGQIGSKSAKGIGTVFGSEAAGNFLLDLWHAHRLLGNRVVPIVAPTDWRYRLR